MSKTSTSATAVFLSAGLVAGIAAASARACHDAVGVRGEGYDGPRHDAGRGHDADDARDVEDDG